VEEKVNQTALCLRLPGYLPSYCSTWEDVSFLCSAKTQEEKHYQQVSSVRSENQEEIDRQGLL
jgi:hypothetical protein